MLHSVLRFLTTYLPVLLPLFVASVVMANAKGWKWDESLYYFFITSSTVGYGDFASSSTAIKCFAILYIPLLVGVAGHLLGNALLRREMLFLSFSFSAGSSWEIALFDLLSISIPTG